jgi:hypothetical protein
VGRRFNCSKDARQVGIQAVVGIGAGGDPGKQLAGVDEVTLGFNGVVFNACRDDAVGQLGIADAVVTPFNVGGKVFADGNYSAP